MFGRGRGKVKRGKEAFFLEKNIILFELTTNSNSNK